jgi:hypothetical protein
LLPDKGRVVRPLGETDRGVGLGGSEPRKQILGLLNNVVLVLVSSVDGLLKPLIKGLVRLLQPSEVFVEPSPQPTEISTQLALYVPLIDSVVERGEFLKVVPIILGRG